MVVSLFSLKLEERIELYNQAMELRKTKGWGKTRIAKVLNLSDSAVKEWLYFGSKPGNYWKGKRLNFDVWNKGLTKETDERVKKISEKLTGKKLTKEHIENCKKGFKKKYLNNPELMELRLEEHSKFMKEYFTTHKHPMQGKKHNPETIEQMKKSHKGHKDNRKGLSFEEFYGIDKSKLIKDKISEKTKLQMEDPKIRKKISKKLTKSIKIKCFTCGKIIMKPPSQIKNHNFCNNKCKGKFKAGKPGFTKGKTFEELYGIEKTKELKNKLSERFKGNRNPNFNNYSSFEPYGLEFNNQLREQIRIRDQFRCQQCFRHQNELYDKKGKKYKLHIHHIDYNKKNNNPENLISLCRNCHTQTNFKREDWEHYFQNKVIKCL